MPIPGHGQDSEKANTMTDIENQGRDLEGDRRSSPNDIERMASISKLERPLSRAISSPAIEAAEILANFTAHPSHPRNWTKFQKWRMTFIVSATGFIATFGSAISVPGVHAITDDFGSNNAKIGVLLTTVYVLGFGAGPFLFSPISELYGRQVAYLTSQTSFIFFCLGAAFSQNITSLLIMRFFSGVFGSSGPGLGMASVADVWSPEERGRPVSLYAIGPMAGPVVGSMVGYWILAGGWRWLFRAVTVLAAANSLLFIFFAAETNAQVVEKKFKYRISHPSPATADQRHYLSPASWRYSLGWMTAMVSRKDASAVFRRTFSRSFRLLFLNPVCAIFCLYYAFIYALIYLFLVSIPLLFGSPPYTRQNLFHYGWSMNVVPLSYIGLGLGFLSAAAIAATVQDKIYAFFKKRNGGQGQPEYRLVTTQIGMILMPIGLLIFGWTATAETHWIGPQIGQFLTAVGLMLAFNSIQHFIVDAFFPYSAAAIAAATATRSVLTSILPIFAADLFTDLGWGRGGTLLAGIAAAAIPVPMIMFIYGRKLRERYAFNG